MAKLAVLSLLLLGALASAQSKKTPRKAPGVTKPECAQGAVCFSGDVRAGQEFRKELSAALDFVLRLPGGIDILSKQPGTGCKLSAWVANPPFMAHHQTEIDASYDWTAEDEVQESPREFLFVTNCADFQTLYDLSQTDAGKYLANLELLAKGRGRLWITDSTVTPSHGGVSPENGAIEWIRFSVEIKPPNPN